METFRDVCKAIGEVIVAGPICIETGTSYTCASGNEVHTTTNNIYEYVAWNHGVFYSLDIEEKHLDYSADLISRTSGWKEGVDYYPHLGDSVDLLKILSEKFSTDGPENTVDFLCLDSKEFDEDHMVNEYNAIKGSLNKEAHFVLVDDIHNPNSVKYKKMVPILKDLGYNYFEVPTPTGLFVAYKGYSL